MAEKKKTAKKTDKKTDKQKTDKKIIAVIGATGAQGGGLVRAILNDKHGSFAARAITRNPNSEKAKALADAGAEVVAADVDDVKSLRKAFDSAHGAFCVTFFWEHLKPEKELSHARNMAQAAKDAGVHHVIWSTLEDTRKSVPLSDDRMPTLMGKYKVPHFDAKGEADEIFRQLGVPTTFLLASFYWENFIYFGMGPKKGPDGKLTISLPMGPKKLAGIAAEDIGKAAYAIFEKGDEMIGKTVGLAGGHLTGAQMAKSMTKALGQEVVYKPVTPAAFRTFGFPGAEDLGNMFQFYSEFEQDCCDARSISETKSLNPELLTFDRWLSQNKERIPPG
ncbi:MAG TPA: NmrA/HSCARG family protein [Gemmatimonadaceae bacterium]